MLKKKSHFIFIIGTVYLIHALCLLYDIAFKVKSENGEKKNLMIIIAVTSFILFHQEAIYLIGSYSKGKYFYTPSQTPTKGIFFPPRAKRNWILFANLFFSYIVKGPKPQHPLIRTISPRGQRPYASTKKRNSQALFFARWAFL